MMKQGHTAFAAAAGAMFVLGAALAEPSAIDPRVNPSGGADAGLCQLLDTRSWGRVGDIHAYSIRTDTWNIGTEPLVWEEFTPEHPLMAQNVYRYKEGRLEQIGLSWIKHGFCALQFAGCGDCFVQQGCLNFLGPGCRDPYSANLNGNQLRLGPRSEVNASTSVFPYPFELGWQSTGDAIYKRIQIHDSDINPDMNTGARYYIEGQIMHVQEGTSEIRHNNATYEEVTPTPSGNTYSLGLGRNPVRMFPAIYAWQANDPQVAIVNADIPGEPVDGRFHLGYRVFDNGDGTWRYEYALHNLNSHRSGQAFSVPRRLGSSVLFTFHRDVKYHSGEVYTNEDWTLSLGDSEVSWSGIAFDQNENANALRWGTMFNFALVSNAAPRMGAVRLALFRPGSPGSVEIPALVPTGAVGRCPADFNGDGQVDFFDYLDFVAAFAEEDPSADYNGDGQVDFFDYLDFVADFAEGCD